MRAARDGSPISLRITVLMLTTRQATTDERLPCLAFALVFLLGAMLVGNAAAGPAKVEPDGDGRGWQLRADGRPFRIRGAGGDASKKMLVEAGGNAFRTWGVDEKTGDQLDEAHRLGLKVVLGIWLEHERHGFDYNDAERVAGQFEKVRASILRHRNHPALLAWALGNEMEGHGDGGNAAVWSHVQACAAMVRKLDPEHPTMTVVAEIGGSRVRSIHRLCPDIDIIGINSYGGVMSIPQRYRKAGGTKPYVVTEFGPPGPWEVEKNGFGAVPELTSTQKGAVYADVSEALNADPLCLGSFAFTWGSKQEATATWFGMILPNGHRTAAVDAMTEAWTGKKPPNLCPTVEPLEVSTDAVSPGSRIQVAVEAADPEGNELEIEWRLYAESGSYFTGGDPQSAPPQFPDAISHASASRTTLTMPSRPGVYRIYAFVSDGKGGGAVANAPLQVKSEMKVAKGTASKLPFVVYGDDAAFPNFVPSGYMGEHKSISMDDASKDNPHSGSTCLKVAYRNRGGWGGVVWQHPPDDWGDRPGGFDLSDAKTLSFHARGGQGGEKVKFGFGVLGSDKRHPDSAGVTERFTLTRDWKRFTIDLDGKDLSRIKTGFLWSAAAQGDAVEFFLDDIRFE
ncbi:MAG: hypothetical protein CMJ18_05470 [Phycisphaeraceae bacterium]|nr:hypothetical protein [Phycisphaeraceae bacterium]